MLKYMQLQSDEKIICEGGIVLYFKGLIKHQSTDKIYLTNKRIFTRVWIPLLNLLMKGINIPLTDLISVEKASWVMDDSLLFKYKENETEKQIKISLSKKRRDEFYNELKKIVPSKCEK